MLDTISGMTYGRPWIIINTSATKKLMWLEVEVEATWVYECAQAARFSFYIY